MSTSISIINKTYSLMIDNTLTDFDQKTLLYLYQPLVGSSAINLLLNFYSSIENGQNESSVLNHQSILKRLKINEESFLSDRTALEAIGLLDSYYLDNHFIYVLKRVLTPFEFFHDQSLYAIFFESLDTDEASEIMYDMLIRKLDISKFKKITCSFDEVYSFTTSSSPCDFGVDSRNVGITLKDTSFDMKYFLVLVDTLDILNNEELNSTDFLNMIQRYAFFYHLNEEQMKDAICGSVNINKEIDQELLIKNIKRIYDNQNIKGNYVKRNEAVKSSDRLTILLETKSPNEIVKATYETSLTSSEIEMFNKLLLETNVSLGVLNTAIYYVLREKNGEIPSYNYFLKILNTWKRAKVYTVTDALNHIKGVNKPTRSTYKTVQSKPKPDWFNDYVENKTEDTKKQEDNSSLDTISLDDVAKFFESKKK